MMGLGQVVDKLRASSVTGFSAIAELVEDRNPGFPGSSRWKSTSVWNDNYET
jgi:hypothetical protein